MRDDLSDITIVVDRSGSMASVKDDAEGGINTFIAEQAKAPGDAVLTLVQFDTEYEFVHRAVPVKEVPAYQLVPRGMTALLDAVGRGIGETGERLAKMGEAERPGLVAFVIVTDGHENSSREFTLEKVHELITHQREKYNWQFTFLGADDSAFDQGHAMGLGAGDIAQYAVSKSREAYKAASSKVQRMRAAAAAKESLAQEFTDEERKEIS
jgi:hypothetical protein